MKESRLRIKLIHSQSCESNHYLLGNWFTNFSVADRTFSIINLSGCETCNCSAPFFGYNMTIFMRNFLTDFSLDIFALRFRDIVTDQLWLLVTFLLWVGLAFLGVQLFAVCCGKCFAFFPFYIFTLFRLSYFPDCLRKDCDSVESFHCT